MKRMRGRGGVYGGVFFLFWGGKLNNEKKITKIKYNDGLRWPPFDILSCSRKTSQKHVGVMEGGRDRLRDRARMLGERDGNDKPLADGGDNDKDKYGEVGDIPDDDDKYAAGVDGANKPLDEGNNECDILGAAPSRAFPESQWPSMPSR